MFVDESIVEFKSGKGGNGCVSFHREKHVPRGGPNGADGGRGGDIVLIASRHERTLYDFKLKQSYNAENGHPAIGNKKGKDGKSIILHVPVGTLIVNVDTGEQITDLDYHGKEYLLCQGGRGGHGNLHYVSSTRQVPKIAENGEPAQEKKVRLELKLLADVGLVGLPNAGKSTLLSVMTRAKPKIGNYPFTTLSPNLGVVVSGDDTFTIADMPGLIEDASEGAGLGIQFLKHIERTKVLLHLIDGFPIDDSDPVDNYKLIQKELFTYSENLEKKPMCVVINKCDIAQHEQEATVLKKFQSIGVVPLFISGVSGKGIPELLDHLKKLLVEEEVKMDESLETRLLSEDMSVPILKPEPTIHHRKNLDPGFRVEVDHDTYRVTGEKVERMVAMTQMQHDESVRYLYRRLKKMGVISALEESGIQDNTPVKIGSVDLVYYKDEQY